MREENERRDCKRMIQRAQQSNLTHAVRNEARDERRLVAVAVSYIYTLAKGFPHAPRVHLAVEGEGCCGVRRTDYLAHPQAALFEHFHAVGKLQSAEYVRRQGSERKQGPNTK